jgi:uncharacterized RDD family membrane protein YckC
MVRRVIAYYIDLVIYLVAALVPLAVLADSRSILAGESLNRVGRIDGVDPYVFKGNTVYIVTESDVITAGLIALAVFLLLAVVLQGLTGRTIGKFVTGIRTVRPDGSRPGLGRAFIRELCWIIDGIPGFAVPLVGGVLALVTTGRRRLGDMLGRTYVVHSRFAGSAIIHPDGDPTRSDSDESEFGATETDATDVVTPVIMMGDDEPEPGAGVVTDDRAEAAWAPGASATEADRADGPAGTPDDSPAPAMFDRPEPQSTPATAPEPEGGDVGSDEPESTGDDGADTGEPETPPTRGDQPTEPHWDPDRRAYISYDPRRGEWVQHDSETGEWGPISRA